MISPESKMRSPDRIIVLEIIDGKQPKSVTGMIDPRLFTGDNKLHAVMDSATTLWFVKYEKGSVPEELKCRFTSFKSLRKAVEDHYVRRNIRIKEVLD